MPPGEFELIERYFTARGASRDDVRQGVGDDGAIVTPRAGSELVLVLDGIVADVHFPAAIDAGSVGHRALAVNLSDLAAMGAEPAWALLGLTVPAADENWLAAFATGLDALARRFGVALIGGDTARGPLSATVMLAGWVPAGQALRRSGAQAGDDIWVSGTAGDAAAGLGILQDRLVATGSDREHLLQRFLQPEPRVRLGIALRTIASACIDISDGLSADLAKLCAASGVGAEVESRHLPLSGALRRVAGAGADLRYAEAGGDDYELLFTASQASAEAVLAAATDVPVRRIGKVVGSGGLRIDGAAAEREAGHGFDHFAG